MDDLISVTGITAIDSGDWTFGAWVFPDTEGEGGIGRIFGVFTAGGAIRYELAFATAITNRLQAQQTAATLNGQAIANIGAETPLAVWSCVFATFTSADGKCRIYQGSPSAAIAELSYLSNTAISGARLTSGTTFAISQDAQAFDGKIARPFLDARLWTLGQMESFRLGRPPRQTPALPIRVFWPLNSSTASNAQDLSGYAKHGTVTGAVVADDPPVPQLLHGAEFG